jgi:hypothetical protein
MSSSITVTVSSACIGSWVGGQRAIVIDAFPTASHQTGRAPHGSFARNTPLYLYIEVNLAKLSPDTTSHTLMGAKLA